jgi:hypothetical protein
MQEWGTYLSFLEKFFPHCIGLRNRIRAATFQSFKTDEQHTFSRREDGKLRFAGESQRTALEPGQSVWVSAHTRGASTMQPTSCTSRAKHRTHRPEPNLICFTEFNHLQKQTHTNIKPRGLRWRTVTNLPSERSLGNAYLQHLLPTNQMCAAGGHSPSSQIRDHHQRAK